MVCRHTRDFIGVNEKGTACVVENEGSIVASTGTVRRHGGLSVSELVVYGGDRLEV